MLIGRRRKEKNNRRRTNEVKRRAAIERFSQINMRIASILLTAIALIVIVGGALALSLVVDSPSKATDDDNFFGADPYAATKELPKTDPVVIVSEPRTKLLIDAELVACMADVDAALTVDDTIEVDVFPSVVIKFQNTNTCVVVSGTTSVPIKCSSVRKFDVVK